MIEAQVQTRTVCPAELDQTPDPEPKPAADAKIAANAAGGDYLAQVIAWGEGVLKLFQDAKADCQGQVKAPAA